MANAGRATDTPQPKSRKKGTVRLDSYVLRRMLLERGWTVEQFARKNAGEIHMRTAQKVFAGEPVSMETAKFVRQAFDVENLLDIVDPSEYTRPDHGAGEVASDSDLRDWVQIERPTRVFTASNGLQYRIYKLRHRYEPNRLGRGKRYELFHLAEDEQQRRHEQLIRHLSVCERVFGCSQFPECLATFPLRDGNVWWVIDRWTEGRTLADALNRGALGRELVPSVMTELADALAAAHEAEVIIRELSPERVLLRESGSGVVVTDFELAKLTDGSPTVSRHWPDDPYRAPEVAAGKADVQADLYSWARILVHCVTGELPNPGEDAELLKTSNLPRGIISVAAKCLARQASRRPKHIETVTRALRGWHKN